MDIRAELLAAEREVAEAREEHRRVAGRASSESMRAGRHHLMAQTRVGILQIAVNKSLADAIEACDEMIKAPMDNVTVRHVLMTRRDAARSLRGMLVRAQNEIVDQVAPPPLPGPDVPQELHPLTGQDSGSA